ncbi:MAG: hypothetical protein GY835_19205 [bacterium]|nr:hypothetical protein [bacterium]
MSPQEAATMLSLSIGASIDEVRARYQDLYSDYQIRLTNAPTPKLKRTYQEKLQQLREACQALAPDIVIEAEKDLPSPEPIHDIASPAERRHSEPTRSTQATVTDHKKKSAGLPRATMVASLLAVVLAAAAAYGFMERFKFKKEITRLEQEVTGLSASLDEERKAREQISGKAEALESSLTLLMNGKLKNCKLKVKNDARDTITIIWLAATYIDKDGAYKTVNSADYGYLKEEIKARRERQIKMSKQDMPSWDGETIFYAMRIKYKEDIRPFAGAWNALQDGVFTFREP